MKAEQVDKALHQKFINEGARLVFWHDTDAEFADYVADGLADELSDVRVLDVAQVGGLSAKLLLEREERSGKYLVYSKGDRPPAEQDWLLDIRLYSVEFHADVTSIWLQELGLSGLYLRDHLRARAAFLGNQERRKKLRRIISAGDEQAAIDMKMMAVLVGTEVASPFDVLRALCHGHLQDGHFALDEPPEVIATFDKMALLDRFWVVMRQEFGYSEASPCVAGLLRRLFVSELFQQMGGHRIDSLAHFELPAAGRRNAVVCLTQWRDSSGNAVSYDAAAAAVGSELNVGEQLSDLSLDTLTDVYTFWEAERRAVSGLKRRVLDEIHSVDVEAVAAIAGVRQAGHWLAGPGCDLPERQAIYNAYDAIVAASGLFALRREHRQSLKFETPENLLTAYRDELHRFDRLYRDYYTKARPSQGQGWDLLKDLAEEVERVYDQGFLEPLGQEWSRLLDGGFMEQWSLKELWPQQDFYARTIRPHVSGTVPKRAFIIISDALRYEAARELTDELNGRYRMNAEISAMLGVLPSYTALGMASLLPHKTMAYNDKGDVLVDDRSVSGTEARNKQLATVGGIACQANKLLAMKRADARAFIDGKRVIYIYHNVIDARGDSASTEEETFDAVSDCISELLELVQFCVNTLNAAKVWVTADHGFIFQQVAPDLTDKSKLDFVPPNTATKKKRYIIGRDLGSQKRAHHGSIEVTAGAGGGMEFWVPRAANRFHFTGGARFVHGGAMPQEVIVPLVAVTHLRGKRKEGTRIEKVSVQVLGDKHKITTPVHRFEIIQTAAVSERRKPITLRAAVYDGGQPVTSVETVTFDSTSDSLEERTKSIQVKLRTGTYDKSKPYRLVLRDVETEAEVQSMQVVIDRSFDDDF